MVSVRRVVVPVLLLVVAIPAFGAARKSSSHPPRELQDWPDADRRSRIVFITRNIAGAALEQSFRAAVLS